MSDNLKRLTDQGVSIWLDDLSRERLAPATSTSSSARSTSSGVTTNPTIFAAALGKGDAYDDAAPRPRGRAASTSSEAV